MCGLLGMYGTISGANIQGKKDFAVEGMIANSLRGFESTGIALLPGKELQDAEPEVYKRAVNGMDFVQFARTRKLVDKFHGSCGFMVHNRASTRGTVHDENAHPFHKGHITLMHNGTLTQYRNLASKYDGHVDSEAICWAMDEHGAEAVLPRLEGSYSLVWWDEADRSLNFARNEGRPMYWIWAEDKSYFVYGSEHELLWWLASRNNLKLDFTIHHTQPMQHYKFAAPEKSEVFSKKAFFHRAESYQWNQGRRQWRGKGGSQEETEKKTEVTGNTGSAREFNAKFAGMPEARIKAMVELAKDWNVHLDRPVRVQFDKWMPYNSGQLKTAGDKTYGKAYCRSTISGADVLIDGVTQAEWRDLSSASRIISVDIIGIRNEQDRAECIFVGRINYDHTQHVAQMAEAQRSTILVLPDKSKEQAAHDDAGASDLVAGPDGKKVTKQEFKRITERGCCNCSESVTFVEAPLLKWFMHLGSSPEFLCPDCGANDQILKDLQLLH